MAWSTPRTWVAGEVPTAAIFNAHVRDNFNETGVAKSTTAGDLVYATGAQALARLAIGTAGQYLTVTGGVPAWGTPGTNDKLYKASDENVISSETLQDDNDLTFAIAASKIYLLRYRLRYNSAGAGGLKYALSVPASATGWMSSLAVVGNTRVFTTSIGTGQNAGVATDDEVWIEAVVVNDTNAGNVVLQWAQNASTASNSTLKQYSSLEYRLIA